MNQNRVFPHFTTEDATSKRILKGGQNPRIKVDQKGYKMKLKSCPYHEKLMLDLESTIQSTGKFTEQMKY